MQQNAKVISVEIDISIPKQDGSGSYKGSRLVYTDDSGKIQTQAFHENTFKFNMALKQQLKELKTEIDRRIQLQYDFLSVQKEEVKK